MAPPFFSPTNRRRSLKTRRREVVIELDQVVHIKRLEKLAPVFCRSCDRERLFIPLPGAREFAGVSLKRMIELLDQQTLHSVKTDGQFSICLTSLFELKRKGKP
jgi:hypothetical protein